MIASTSHYRGGFVAKLLAPEHIALDRPGWLVACALSAPFRCPLRSAKDEALAIATAMARDGACPRPWRRGSGRRLFSKAGPSALAVAVPTAGAASTGPGRWPQQGGRARAPALWHSPSSSPSSSPSPIDLLRVKITNPTGRGGMPRGPPALGRGISRPPPRSGCMCAGIRLVGPQKIHG